MPKVASPRRWFAAALLAALALGGCATLEHEQRRLIFQPAKDTWWAGAQAAEGMAPVWIDFESRESGAPARLHGLWLGRVLQRRQVLLVQQATIRRAGLLHGLPEEGAEGGLSRRCS